MIIDLMRHGSTGRDGYLDGRTDRPLSAEGWEQFRRQTAGRTWQHIVTSPLLRAHEPAQALADEQNIPIRVDGDWAELDFGGWDGRLRSDLASDPTSSAALTAFYDDPRNHPAPGGEAWPGFVARIHRAVSKLAASTATGPVLIVTHAGPIRVALAEICGIALPSLWAVRIGYATRVRLSLGIAPDGKFWGEILEITQP